MPTYTSPDHSPEDPGGILKEQFAMGAAFPGPAEDALLAWTLRLAPEVDTQAAARTLIQRYGLAEGEGEGDSPHARLVRLLRETADKGTAFAAAGRRRGGWRGRRGSS